MEGNFKGLGDWDEALVVGKNADGTYVLEYVDEGLIEEDVPASRIRLPSGADGAADDGEGIVASFVEGESVMGNFKGLGCVPCLRRAAAASNARAFSLLHHATAHLLWAARVQRLG